jgi:hypothetical protein
MIGIFLEEADGAGVVAIVPAVDHGGENLLGAVIGTCVVITPN